jgi:hypothetical protein
MYMYYCVHIQIYYSRYMYQIDNKKIERILIQDSRNFKN